MSGFVFVCDAQGTPLMPMSPAYARRLLASGKAVRKPHHAFSIIQLTRTIHHAHLRPVVLGVALHLNTAELLLLVDDHKGVSVLLSFVVDLRTDLPWRMRRRAAHRRRRRYRGRYRKARLFGHPFVWRRPSMRHSRWGQQRRRRTLSRRTGQRLLASQTIRWRAQGVLRVIQVLRQVVPVSHVVMVVPQQAPAEVNQAHSTAELHQLLVAVYGVPGPDGILVARCAYCGTTKGEIVVDHLLPRSRGGTDAWNNLVLACVRCNDRKGARTPAEASMPLLLPISAAQRGVPYVRQTAALLWKQLGGIRVVRLWLGPCDVQSQDLTPRMLEQLLAFSSAPLAQPRVLAVKLVSRPRKQRYRARNYPLTTPLKPGMVRLKQAVKQLVRVNRGLAIIREGQRHCLQVVGVDDPLPANTLQLITIGMLCEAKRAGVLLRGMVVAVHSDSRLTLLVPRDASAAGIRWERVLVRPSVHLRVISTDRILFFAIPGSDKQQLSREV